MSDSRVELPRSRARLGWWLFVGLLAVVAAWIAISFVGILVLGIGLVLSMYGNVLRIRWERQLEEQERTGGEGGEVGTADD